MPDASPPPIEVRAVGNARYLDNDSVLRLTVFNAAAGVTVRLSGRRLDLFGRTIPFVHRLVPATNRTASTFDLELDEGWLLGAEATITAGTPQDGQTYAVLSIGVGRAAGFEELETFAADTISAARRLSWPGTLNRGPLDGRGALRSITGTSPAAGAEISETVPTGARWELIAFRTPIVTNATAGNRTTVLFYDDGVNRLASFPAMAVIAPSTNSAIEWAQGSTAIATINGQNAPGLIPPLFTLPAAARIRTATANLAAGDQYGAPQYLVREWIEGA